MADRPIQRDLRAEGSALSLRAAGEIDGLHRRLKDQKATLGSLNKRIKALEDERRARAAGEVREVRRG